MSNRIEQLDSIRGLASLTVLWHHMWMITPVLPIVFSYSPLRLAVYGHAAVILFFILSGFVLALPFLSHKQGPYLGYLVKRICRIYLPYVVSLFVAIVLANGIAKGDTGGLSGWIDRFWNYGWDGRIIMEHMALVANIHTDAYNTVVWSLIHEMRISIIFPLIMLLVIRLSWQRSLLVCVLLSSVASLNGIFEIERSNGYMTTYFDTLHFVSFFIIGALLAKHRAVLTESYAKLGLAAKTALSLAAVAAYGYSKMVEYILPEPYAGVLTEYGIATGACVLIIAALSSVRLAKLLQKRPVILVGKISYSLYLYHFIILVALVHLLNGVLPIPVIYAFVLILSIAAAALSYRFVEMPSAKLGRRLEQRLGQGLKLKTAQYKSTPPDSAGL
ncbi:MAG: Acyltransferase family protein [Paenibacillaceae bacterium]|jgi:peptidoglycan/LPS O-acetylase OafA/YrhL|nr:Acyltransferase family protein [Paenibacillaceae bacterium]